MSRNRNQWLSVADFLARQNLRLVLRDRQRGQGGQAQRRTPAAALSAAAALPVGNHGEIVGKGQSL